MSERLLIAGASARAAAMSAIRSGFEPYAIDRFGDLDLKACATAVSIPDYPAGLEQALAVAPPGPWMYTGALENRPELIERISRARRLHGIGGESLRAVRYPFRLAAALSEAGMATPDCRHSAEGLPHDGSWLCKSMASAGGCGVRPWMGDSLADSSPRLSEFYFQQRIDGAPIAAIFVATERRAELLGVTRQLIGLDWCGLPRRHGHRFRYCGSIGPLLLSTEIVDGFERLGNTLAAAFDLRGLFGVDAILSDEGEIWPVEVNPRYTASVEILEWALGLRSIARHVEAFGVDCPEPPSVQSQVAGSSCGAGVLACTVQAGRPHQNSARSGNEPISCGKAILFADRNTAIAASFPDYCMALNRNGGWPTMADIPTSGTMIHAGQPIVTVFAAGANEATVLASLQVLASSTLCEIAGHETRPA